MARTTETKTTEFPDGVYTVLVTPFTETDEVDFEALDNSLKHQYSTDVAGIVALGTTSESPTLSKEEKLAVAKHVYQYNEKEKANGNGKFLVIGVGGNNTKSVLEFSGKVVGLCDAFMVTVPNYNKPQQRGIVDLYQQVSKGFPDTSIMIYNIPGRTGVDFAPEFMAEVVRTCPNVVALKEASGNYENVAKFVEIIENEGLRDLTSEFKLFSGDDVNAVRLCKDYKGRGVISVASNVIPNKICSIAKSCVKGDFDSATTSLAKTVDFIKFLFVESNPVPVKNVMHQIGLYPSDRVRRPLMELDDDEKRRRLLDLYRDVEE